MTLDDRAARIIVKSLPHDANPCDIVRRNGREVHVDQRAVAERQVEQRPYDLRAPRQRSIERHEPPWLCLA